MKIVAGRVRVAASDVANFLACQELTQLDLRAARRTLRPPHPRDLGFEELVRRGEEHERGVLERVPGGRAPGGGPQRSRGSGWGDGGGHPRRAGCGWRRAMSRTSWPARS